ncbi:hypothetical protein BD289DRAFT_364404 [Coniella lustricola]|uniref:Uncharacterized protein n=1 Tax=Coniella lustricola TaxID=2025994 RepID=A0A2T3ADR7_9PEZI|nr:hypothetical protein BD289DRAFT_364404 [Coniella lustricola]
MPTSCRVPRISPSSSNNAVSSLSGSVPRPFFTTRATQKTPVAGTTSSAPIPKTFKPLTTLQETPRNLPEAWFNPTFPYSNQGGDKPPDERKVKLGKTLRVLQERLPTLLQSPLPHDILAPNISLHLFPSTHPHLPTVSGRVAYIAALWTSPLAWNHLPLIGDVKLEILSERMVKEQGKRTGSASEQLVVRWRTTGASRIRWRLPFRELFQTSEEHTAKGFTGLFIFEFDEEGRILSHTIEHVQSGGEWENGVGAKFVGLTDWLLGGMRGGREGCPAFEIHDARRDSIRRRR